MKLKYEKKAKGKLQLESKIYKFPSIYQDEERNRMFLQLKANICDLNPALITKCVTGTEQDFLMLMNRAKDFVITHYPVISDDEKKVLLEMFRQSVFGYYVLTPLIESKEVSDVKVLDYNHIVVKANGERYVADISFFDEADYKGWFERMQRIHRLGKGEENALSHCTDRKGVKDFYLRIDAQQSCITSTEKNNIHIRKMPKEKYSWEYLKENRMLDDEMIAYLEDRIGAGYSMLISGKGGSGKSTLLNMIAGVLAPTSGEILIDGVCMTEKTQSEKDKFRIQKIGYIFQDFKLINDMTVMDNINILKLEGVDTSGAAALLEKLGIAEKKNARIKHLSGGQKQRVAIARALVKTPDIILADEPTGNLNFAIGEQVIRQLVEVAKGKTLIAVTHDDRLAQYFDAVIDMNTMTSGMQDLPADGKEAM